MLDCAVICLLATEVSIQTAHNNSACGFCVDARSSHEDCFDNVIDCAYKDPKGIIFCMNFFETEHGGDLITKTTRCLSYYDLLIPDDAIREIVANGLCHYRDRQFCDCKKVCTGRNASNSGRFIEEATTPTPVRRTTKAAAAVGHMKMTTGRPGRVDYGDYGGYTLFEQAKTAILRFFYPNENGSSLSFHSQFITLAFLCILLLRE